MAAIPAENVPAGVLGATGVYETATGLPLQEAEYNANFKNVQAAQMYSELAGVMAGGVCTVSGSDVIVPVGTVVYARALYIISTDPVSVAINEFNIEYVWLCSDGQIRKTATTTPPPGFDTRTAALICKGDYSGGIGTLTVDNSVQRKSRYADATTQVITDGPLQLDYANNQVIILSGGGASIMDSVPSGRTIIVPAGFQAHIFDKLTVYGTYRIYGKVRISG